MPPAVAAAGITATGAVAGGAAAGKGASKAAKIQAQTAQAEMAQDKEFYNDAVTRYQPDIDQANTASSLYAGLLGDGGDANASQTAFNTFKNSIDYQNTLDAALKGVNASAYATGMGNSGAAYKALQDRAATIADSTLNTYLGNLNTQVQTGANAKAALSGAATTALNNNNTATANAGTAAANAAATQGASTASILTNLGNLAGNAYQSSYGNGSLTGVLNGVSNFGNSAPIAVYNNPDYSEG